MPLLITGLRYTTAALNIREQIAFSETELPDALACLMAMPAVTEAGILTTCNRVELHLNVTDLHAGKLAVATFFNTFKQFNVQQYQASVFAYVEEDAIRHLLTVAACLDSIIMGEGQILGQVRDAFELAKTVGTVGKQLHQLYTTALHTGKLVRTQTGIASRDTSISSAAYQLAKQLDADTFEQQTVLIIGGGKMAELLLERFKQEAMGNNNKISLEKQRITVVNRSHQRLTYLQQKFGFNACTFEALPSLLLQADTIFVATSAPHPLLYAEHFADVRKPLRIFDISVPRNVDDSVGSLPGVNLHNTDDLVGVGTYCPETEARIRQEAEQLIEVAYWEFKQWQQLRSTVQPTLVAVRSQAEQARLAALAQAKEAALSGEALAEWSRVLINKVLHAPSVALRQQATTHLPLPPVAGAVIARSATPVVGNNAIMGKALVTSVALPLPPTPVSPLDWAV
jgi:glutamyl-tRNA reductase